jgi:DNA-binding LytR/AlgR family response regulator
MKKILIIEDEALAIKKLKRFIAKVCPEHIIIAEIDTVNEAISLLSTPTEIDIIFADIELRDGNVFDVFSQVTVTCPIIFSTAYDKFLMNAFKTNGIEYLLKPYSFERFDHAWQKYLALSPLNDTKYTNLLTKLSVIADNSAQENTYKKRFSIKSQQSIYFVNTDDIVYFQSNSGIIFAFDRDNKRHIMPYASFVAIESTLDPQQFFRINRSEIIQLSYIDKLERYCKNSLAIYLNASDLILKTSHKRTAEFNQWLGL